MISPKHYCKVIKNYFISYIYTSWYISKMDDKRSSIIVSNDSELENWIDKGDDFLLLLDIHLDWTGQCETIIPQLDELYRNIDQSEKRWKALAVEVPTFVPTLISKLKLSPNCSQIMDNQGRSDGSGGMEACSLESLMKKPSCSPLFLLVKGYNVVSVVHGANFPVLSKAMCEHMPVIMEEENI